MWALATDKVVVETIERMLGKDVHLYASQLHRKAPNAGHEVPWHQDGNEKVRTLWITLDPVDRFSAPRVHFGPFIHKLIYICSGKMEDWF